MSRNRSRRGNPFMRLALVVAGIGIFLAVAGALSYQAFVASRSTPLAVPIYSDAQLVANTSLGSGHDRLRYLSPSPAEEVGAFYEREIGCTRVENRVQSPDLPAFQYNCVADGSALFLTQYTVVIVQPGVGDYAGQTLISIERFWTQ